MRALHECTRPAGEFVRAIVAKEISGLGFPSHAHDVQRTAMRADNNAVRPARGFDVVAGGVLVDEISLEKTDDRFSAPLFRSAEDYLRLVCFGPVT